uniref:Uncharacterized protein n=1 Tax=Zea mays TaxID=4577 RepID=A0A804MF46_MAIZE
MPLPLTPHPSFQDHPRIRPCGTPPVPTPIRTARGARTVAADERVLVEFLEASLRGDAGVEQQAIAAAAESGVFRVTGAVDAREVRDAMEAASGLVSRRRRRRSATWGDGSEGEI